MDGAALLAHPNLQRDDSAGNLRRDALDHHGMLDCSTGFRWSVFCVTGHMVFFEAIMLV